MRVVAGGRALKLAVTSRTTGHKPTSFGRFRPGSAGARVNRAFAGRPAGNPLKYWSGGQGGRKRPFHAGFRACLPAMLFPPFRPSTSSTPSISSTPSPSPVLANPRIIARLPEQTRHPATARPGPHDKKRRAGFHCRISITIATSITPVLIAP